MSLDLTIKFIGWGMALVPLTIFLVISAFMVWGAGEDDEVIRALTLLGLAVFSIGVIVLILSYFTSILTFTPTEETAMLFL